MVSEHGRGTQALRCQLTPQRLGPHSDPGRVRSRRSSRVVPMADRGRQRSRPSSLSSRISPLREHLHRVIGEKAPVKVVPRSQLSMASRVSNGTGLGFPSRKALDRGSSGVVAGKGPPGPMTTIMRPVRCSAAIWLRMKGAGVLSGNLIRCRWDESRMPPEIGPSPRCVFEVGKSGHARRG